MVLTRLRSVEQGHTPRKLGEQGGLGHQTKPPGHRHLNSCSRKLLHEVQAVGSDGHQSRMREGVACRRDRGRAARRRRPEEGTRCPTFTGQNRAACHCSVQRPWVENPRQWQSPLHTSELVRGFTSSDALFPPGLLLLCPNKTEETRPARCLALKG